MCFNFTTLREKPSLAGHMVNILKCVKWNGPQFEKRQKMMYVPEYKFADVSIVAPNDTVIVTTKI